MGYKNDWIDFSAVKALITMEQVLSHYGILGSFTRKGDSLSGICPIHKGRNPTQFRVSISKNCWNCFSDCHCGGNTLDFIAKMEDKSIREAAQLAIKWFNLKVNTRTSESDRQRVAPDGTRHTSSVHHKKHESTPSPAVSPPAVSEDSATPNKPLKFKLELDATHPYLNARGLNHETVQEFGLGYCSRGMLKERIAIPIHNLDGEIVAFAGRWLDNNPPEDTPKYKLPKGFCKGLEVYRLYKAIQEPLEVPLVIVEGYFSTARLWQMGIRKCVSLMGSTLSPAQESLIVSSLKPDSHVIVALDEDDAGRAGRDDIVKRLSPYAYIRSVKFPEEGFQPDNLTLEMARSLHLLSMV